MSPLTTFPPSMIALHNKPDDLWIIIDQAIYDVSKYQHEHPGGQKVMKALAGKDATKSFRKNHNEYILGRHEELKIGIVDASVAGEKKAVPAVLSRVFSWGKRGPTKGQEKE